MATGPAFSLPVSDWLQIRSKEADRLYKALDDERKARGKREFVLVVTCLLALLYTYPVTNLSSNPEIDIPSISLKIPLKEALTVFPTLVAATYLVFFSSAIGQASNMLRLGWVLQELREGQETGVIPNASRFLWRQSKRYLDIRYLLLPSPLHPRLPTSGDAAAISRFFVEAFVGFVFVLLPYVTSVFVSLKGWRLVHSKMLFGWDAFCILVMLGTLMSGVLAISTGD